MKIHKSSIIDDHAECWEGWDAFLGLPPGTTAAQRKRDEELMDELRKLAKSGGSRPKPGTELGDALERFTRTPDDERDRLFEWLESQGIEFTVEVVRVAVRVLIDNFRNYARDLRTDGLPFSGAVGEIRELRAMLRAINEFHVRSV